MFDINTPVTNPELVSAIEAIQKNANADTQDSFFKALKNAKFLSPVLIEPHPESGDADGKTTLDVDTKISFFGFTDTNVDNYLPVYTDWPALKQWRNIPNEQTLITSYDDISHMVLKEQKTAGFVINPYSHNIPVRRDLILYLNALIATKWTTDVETTIHLDLPSNEPVALKEAVTEYLKTQKNVTGIWLVLMEKSGEFSFLIVIDFVGDRDATFNGIASAAVPKLREGELIDIVPSDSDLGQKVISDYPPFYKRET